MRRQIRIAAVASSAAFFPVAWLGWVAVAAPIAEPPTLAAAAEATQPAPLAHFATGVSSCAAVACHGGDSSEIGVRSAYTRWKSRDPHARAGEVLYGGRALAMAAVLQSSGAMPAGEKPSSSPMCIQCHGSPAVAAPGSLTAVEGVSCEQCHGAAGAYLDKHFEPSWRALDSAGKAAYGMADTKNLAVRADACIKCHQGGPGFEVTHDMIAAGHPLLRFEFRSYLAHYPGKHWRDEASIDLAAWMLGQQAGAKAAAALAIDRGDRGLRPVDFANGDCTACHRTLTQHPAGPRTPQLGFSTWFGWQASGLRFAASESADAFAEFARAASASNAQRLTWRPLAATVQSVTPNPKFAPPLLPKLESLIDYATIANESWESALQRRLAAEAMVAAAKESYEERIWARRHGVAQALERLRRATAAWQEFRSADALAAWKAMEASLHDARGD